MNTHRFSCTACGKCCYGWLPLTVDEALAGADTFPLAMSVTPISVGRPEYALVESLSKSLAVPARRKVFLLVSPISFIPPAMPCPKLRDNLCSIHDTKPLRCRNMPFYAFRDEAHQAGMLVPREGWLCDTGLDAPVVYENGRIVDREDFAQEQEAIRLQSPILQRYVDLLLRYDAQAITRIQRAAKSAPAGRVVLNFLSFVRYNRDLDMVGFAHRQLPVLAHWAERTADNASAAEYYNFYRAALAEMERYWKAPT